MANPMRPGYPQASIASSSVLRPQLLSSNITGGGQAGAERIPIAAAGHAGRRVSGTAGEQPMQKESMNCKSCRKKKIKCNRMRPSCGACLAFQCGCIYDAIPKKRGPKTEVLEELLKRVSGLEKRLQEEKEANMAKRREINGVDGEPSLDSSGSGEQQQERQDLAEGHEIEHKSTMVLGNNNDGDVMLGITDSSLGVDPDAEPPLYASLSPAASSITAADDSIINSPTPPIAMDLQSPAIKRRRTSEVDGDLESKGIPQLKRTRSIQTKIHGMEPFDSTQYIGSYIDAFFTKFHGKPYDVLHEETFRTRLAKCLVHPSQLHIVCAIGAKYVHSGSRGHVLCVQYTDAARAAVDMDFPSFENFQTLVLVSMCYFYIGKGYKAFMCMGAAVRMAYGLDLTRELPSNASVTPVEREVRRRAFWSCYLMDRFVVCGSKKPPMLLEESIQVHLPSSIPQMRSLDEQYFTSHMGGMGNPHLGGVINGAGQPNAWGGGAAWRERENASAFCIDITKILGIAIRYIEQGGVKADNYFPWHHESKLKRIRNELDSWSQRTSHIFTGDTPGEALYLQHPEVTTLVMAKAIFHLVNCLIYRPFLPVALRDSGNATGGGFSNGLDYGGEQKNWQTEATKNCFNHANAIGDLVAILNHKTPEGFQWPPIIGYCLMTAATIHLHGAYYRSTQPETIYSTSAAYFNRELAQLHAFHDKWPAVRLQYVMLKRLIKAHQELVRSIAETKNTCPTIHHNGMGITVQHDSANSHTGYWTGYSGSQNVFQLNDFFERYPNREQYFDGAQCPFVEDMMETATRLNFENGGDADISMVQLQRDGVLTPVVTPAPIQSPSGGGNTTPLPYDSQQQQYQYDAFSTSESSYNNSEKWAWDDRHRQLNNIPTRKRSHPTLDYLGRIDRRSPSPAGGGMFAHPKVNPPRSTPTTGNFETNPGSGSSKNFTSSPSQNNANVAPDYLHNLKTQHTRAQLGIIDMSYDNSAASSPSESAPVTPTQPHASYRSSQYGDWYSGHGLSHQVQSDNGLSKMDTQSVGFGGAVPLHSGTHDGAVINENNNHSNYNTGVQGGMYSEHQSHSHIKTEPLPNEHHIHTNDLSGDQAYYDHEEPDPVIMYLLAQTNPHNQLGAHVATPFESSMSMPNAGLIPPSSQTVGVVDSGLASSGLMDVGASSRMAMTTGMGMGYDTWMGPRDAHF